MKGSRVLLREEIYREACCTFVDLQRMSPEERQVDSSYQSRIRETAALLKRYGVLSSARTTDSGHELSAFISCSAAFLLDNQCRMVDRAKEIVQTEIGFRPLTGEISGARSASILNDVIDKIEKSELFLAILTNDVEGGKRTGQGGSLPSQWIPFEVGVAYGLNKPIGFLVSDEVDEHYYRRIFGGVQSVLAKEITREFDKYFTLTLRSAYRYWISRLERTCRSGSANVMGVRPHTLRR